MTYWALRRSVRVLVEDDRERILTLRVEGYEGIYHELPGGGIDPGESVTEAAAREVREETGYDDLVVGSAVAHRWAEYRRPQGRVGQDEVIVRARLRSDRRVAIDPVLQDDGVLEVVWLSRDDLRRGGVATDPAHPSILAALADDPGALSLRVHHGLEPLAPDLERYARHAIEVAHRWGASRYDGAVHRDGPDLQPGDWVAVAARVATPPGERNVVLAVAPDAAPTADVRHHPAVALRVARTAEDHEQAAVVTSAALGADLAVVRRVLGPNVAHLDGASRLVAVRGHQVIGTVTLVLTEDAADGQVVAGVHALAVAPHWRGRGTGRSLVARALELAAGAGATVAYTDVPTPVDTLTSLGFHEL